MKKSKNIDNTNLSNEQIDLNWEVKLKYKKIKNKWIEKDLNSFIRLFSTNWFIYKSEIPKKIKDREEVKKNIKTYYRRRRLLFYLRYIWIFKKR